jgi:hypothetical protein
MEDGTRARVKKLVNVFDISYLLRHAIRQKHLLTFSLLLLCHPPSALALALLFWQTPKICEFAQLNWRLHQTQGEGSYGG